MTNHKTALLPCPFCGGIKISRMKLDKEPLVSCENKGCPIYDRQMRINEWNTRTALQAVCAERDALRGLCEGMAGALENAKHRLEGAGMLGGMTDPVAYQLAAYEKHKGVG